MSRDGGLLAAFEPAVDAATQQIQHGYSKLEPVIKLRAGTHEPVFFGVCVEVVKKKDSRRPATAQVDGIVTVPVNTPVPPTWRYHDLVYATRADADDPHWEFSLEAAAEAANTVAVGYLLDASADRKQIRVQIDRSLAFFE